MPTTPQEVRLTDETIKYLNEQIKDAVAHGITAALNEDNAKRFWSAGLSVLQEEASNHAGRFLLGGVWAVVRKLSMFAMLAGLAYALGGWAGLVKLRDVIFTPGA